MQVRTFTAPTIAEALDAVRKAFGPDAVILETRALRLEERETPERAFAVKAARDAGEEAPRSARKPEPKGFEARLGARQDIRDLREEIQGLRGLLFQALDLDERRPVGWSPRVMALYAGLRGGGMSGAEATRWAGAVAAALPKGSENDERLIRALVRQLVIRDVPIGGALRPRTDGRQQRVALVGATGVGKTTTIAKLAAAAALREGRRVAFLTVDTYRIAAVEQLRVYAGIMGLRIEVVGEPEETPAALRRLAEADLVLIDTAGRSPRGEAQLAELEAYLRGVADLETCFVAPATQCVEGLADASRRFARFGPDRLVISKADEAEGVGAGVELARTTRIPIAYVTTGQGVPDDIVAADAAWIAAELLERGHEPSAEGRTSQVTENGGTDRRTAERGAA